MIICNSFNNKSYNLIIVSNMNQSHSQIHQSIYQSQSNPHIQRNSKTQFILESKVEPIRILETKKSNNLDFSKTGKPTPPQSSNFILNKTSLQSRQSRNDILDLSKTNSRPIQSKTSLQNKNKKQQRPQSAQVHHPPSQPNMPFIQYYEENINLKKLQSEMTKQIEQLKNQVYEQSLVRKTANQRQLQMLAAGKKSLWDTKQSQQPQRLKNMQQKDKDSGKITNLLQIIQHYKQKLMTSQQQVQNLKRQKHLLEQDGLLKQKKADQILQTFKDSSSKVNTANIEEQLRNTTRLLQIQKQRNRYNEADIKRLQTKIRTLQVKQDQVDDLKQQNRNLEQKIMRFTQLPSFSTVTDRVDQERKVKQMESKYKTLNQKYNQLKNDHVKSQAELKLLRNQLIKANIQSDQLQKQNLKLKQYSIDNPILNKLSEDQDLLAEVVYQIQSRKNQRETKAEPIRQNYQKIMLQKQQLANELISLRAKMTAMQQTWRQKQRMSKIEKQELINTFKQQAGSVSRQQAKIMSKNGVPYTDDVSMFTQDTVNLSPGSNYFDLFLGQLHLLETMLITTFNIRSTDNALILATVDFYNHNTQTTRPVHGIHSNLQSQFSFKVTEDDFLFKYLNKGTFTIQVWASEGNKRINLGKASVDLRSLVLKSKKNLAPVASSSAPIYMNQKVIGSINFVMRLRLPIFDQLQRIKEIQQIVSTQQAPTRRLIIQVQQGRGLPQSSNTFVYFSFRLQDFYTKTFKGTNPIWNYHKAIQLKYNNDLKNYLRKNQIQLVVLDDNAIITNEGDSDVVGTAFISLVPLLQNKIIRQRLTIMKGAQKVGQVDVKLYWHESQLVKDSEIKLIESKSIGQQISQFLVANKLQPQNIFYQIDNNKTGMISFEQFLNWVLKINSKINYQMANNYYKQFKQPVNLINFTTKLNELKQSHTSEIAKQLSAINRLVSQNTEMIKKKQSFEDYLKGKDIDTVCLDIDKSQNGMISNQELKEYFEAHNIEPPVETFQKGQIQIVKFLKKYQNMT